MGIENAILIGLSRQVTLRNQMDMVANNIANMNTTAYKAGELQFREFLVDTPEGDKMSYVEGFGTLRNLTEGPLKPTGNPLDLAISGQGYFAVQTDQGIQYTRNGHFRLNDDGALTTMDGDPVLDVDNQEILFDDPGAVIEISRDGTVSGAAQDFRIGVYGFANEQGLEPVEGGLFKTDEGPEAVEQPDILQGVLEGSNVEPIVQLTRMIDVQRSYEANQTMMKTDHDLQFDAIERLGRVV